MSILSKSLMSQSFCWVNALGLERFQTCNQIDQNKGEYNGQHESEHSQADAVIEIAQPAIEHVPGHRYGNGIRDE